MVDRSSVGTVNTISRTDKDAWQHDVDTRNADFWNTLCGTSLALELGITDSSPASLEKFDTWYFNFYPYLADFIPFDTLSGRRVLEVGLGYGTVSQRLAQCGADYTGLDVAAGPVDMVNYRLASKDCAGRAQRGSILDAPFADDSFDCIVAIGCYHHTGNLQRAFDESYRLLRPSGLLVAMVYNAYSYRRWCNALGPTARYLLWDLCGVPTAPQSGFAERAAYDLDTAGNAAPHTDFVSRRHLRRICARYSSFNAALANIAQEKPFIRRSREELLRSRWPALCGLDIYIRARK